MSKTTQKTPLMWALIAIAWVGSFGALHFKANAENSVSKNVIIQEMAQQR